MKKLFNIACLALTVSASQAQIINVTGGSQIVPPANATDGQLTDTTQGFVWQEREPVELLQLTTDHDGSAGTFDLVADFMPGSLTGTYSAYYMHMDNVGSQKNFYTLTVEFAQEIKGVLITDDRLDATDASIGAPGTTYPNGLSLRGFDEVRDDLIISADRKSITYDGRVFGAVDGVRVFTNPVPEPTTMAALGLGALALLRRKRSR
jgi:hypothetical protein